MIQVEISRRPSCRKLRADDFVITEMAAEHLFHTMGICERTNLASTLWLYHIVLPKELKKQITLKMKRFKKTGDDLIQMGSQ
ncbi:hypothetical protein TNCV_2741191 [Trichonephila clavipes]|nr:hypothetical protein TNCV_2741191 [Trichonephila clavipes]